MPDQIPKPDVEFSAFAEQVITAFEADEVGYALLPADTLALRSELNAFKSALAAAIAAKSQSTLAVADKDQERKDVEMMLRPIIQRVQVNPNVTDAQRVAAGIRPRDTTRTTSAPIAPRDLVATADGAGTNTLKWNSNGNTSGIQYLIQGKVGPALEFATVDVVTSTTYRHTARVVGQPVLYRVIARRGENVSAPSNSAGVHV